MIHRSFQIAAVTLTFAFALPSLAGENRWTSQGPYGGDVATMAVDPANPSILYAGTIGNGIFKSSDRGASWSSVDGGLPIATSVSALAIDPANPAIVYAALRIDGVVKSSNRGSRWRAMNAGLPEVEPSRDVPWVETLAIDPSNSATVYAGFLRDGLWRSHDGAASWQAVVSLAETEVRGVAVDPSDSATIYAATGGGVYKSVDGGASWAPLAGGLEDRPYSSIVVAPDSPETVYATSTHVASSRLYRSRDGGATWTQLTFGGSTFLRALLLDPTDPDVLYAATTSNSDVFKSTDGGDSWSSGSDGIASPGPVTLAIDPMDPSILYAGSLNDAGVFKSTDGGVQWTPANEGLNNTEVLDVAVDPMNPSNLYATSNQGVFKSVDGGATWAALDLSPLPVPTESLAIDPQDTATVYVGGGGNAGPTGRGIFKTTDAGKTWEVSASAFTVPGAIEELKVDPRTPATVYAGTGEGVFRSFDAGGTWAPAGEIRPGSFLIDFEIDPATPAILYAATQNFSLNGRISKSLDGGDTWFFSDDGIPASFILLSLAIDPQNPATLYATGLGGVYKTTDGGGNWRPAGALPLDLSLTLAVDPRTSSTVYASTVFGVSKSIDGGDTWYPLGEGLTNAVFDLEVDSRQPAILHAGTQGGGAFKLVQDIDCEPGIHNLCLDDEPGDQRFEVTLTFDTDLGAGASGTAEATPLTSLGVTSGGVLSFFDATNPEVLVKVLDGCGFNDRFWVFYAATTTVGFRLQVTDTVAGISRIYTNSDQNTAATVTDIDAFPTCEAPSSSLSLSPVHPPHPSKSLAAVEARAGAPLSLGGRGEWEGEGKGVRGSCTADATTLCIDDQPGDGRFRISAAYDTVLGPGAAGDASAIPLASVGITRGGILWFFDETNPEILVKVLDGCDFNGHYWVFYAATTTAGFTLTVEDTIAGEERVFVNPDLQAAEPVADIVAFATCGGS